MNLGILKIAVFAGLLLLLLDVDAQLVINEASNRNLNQSFDEDGENVDWFELYNNSDDTINLAGWSVSDDQLDLYPWSFPGINLAPRSHLLVFASGKNRGAFVEADRWESPILPTDIFHYLVPDETTPTYWNTLPFDPSEWDSGQAGFGYGDDDDSTMVEEGTMVIYIRKNFNVPDSGAVISALCHVDYDDGFVAYLNGTEICRSPNISGTPSWDSRANSQHDAVMFEGGTPNEFHIDRNLLKSTLREGDNVFAIEVHNVSETSSDLTVIPFLSFAIQGETSYFPPAPSWINTSLNSNLHTDFKLSLLGDSLFLYKEEILVDSFVVSRTEINYSTGRKDDGVEQIATFTHATPGRTNNYTLGYTKGYEPSPMFSPMSGFYKDSILVRLNVSSESADVYYTTNGNIPTESSTKYEGSPIWVTESTVIRARAFSTAGKLPSIASASTYFIDADYSIPTLSVITDPSNLYGTNGIFTNYNREWNKPCYFEFFDTTKTLFYKQEAAIQVDGGAGGSRSKPQTSFRIEPGHSIYGAGDMEYKLFPDRPERNIYSSFYVRNGSNQYLILPHKDAVEVKGMSENTYNYYSAYRPIAVHINGGFYGIYELREKINENYLEHNLGYDIDSLDLIGVSYWKGQQLEAIEGSIDAFVDNWNHFLEMDEQAPDFLEEVNTFLDLDNYTDYMAGQIWIANRDWPWNNIKAWRCASTDYRWQFALIDLEWSFRPHEWSTSATDAIEYVSSYGIDIPYTGFWNKMMQIDEYKYRFINRMADLMNLYYNGKNLKEIEMEMWLEASPMMHLEYERWGTKDVEGQMETYTDNHMIFRNELGARSYNMKNHLMHHYDLDKKIKITLEVNDDEAGEIKISTIRPPKYKWQGEYFSDVPIPFRAIPKHGYVFSHWDESPYISDPTSEEFTATISDSYVTFKAHFVEGSKTYTGITISEINYKDADRYPTADWFEIFNSTGNALNLTGWYFTDRNPLHRYEFADNTVIPANERLVVTGNQKLFSIIYPEVTNVCGDFLFGLNGFSDDIKLYNSQDELIVSVSYSNRFPWPLMDNLEGRTLELLDPNEDLDDPENWFAGCPLGSPGSKYTKDCQHILGIDKDETLLHSDPRLQLKAYPNPAGEHLTIEFYLEDYVDHLSVKIYNMQGSMVMQEIHTANQRGVQTIPMTLSNIQPGQLLFIVVSGSNYYETVKVIK